MENRTFDVMNTGGAVTSTTTGETIAVPQYRELTAYLSVTAVSGTAPTLNAVIESSPDGSVWYTHTSFTQATASTTEAKSLSNFGKNIRVVSTLGGTTPSFTFTLKATGKA